MVVYKNGVKYEMQKIEITPGEVITIEAIGTALANNMTIAYEESQTGFERKLSSNLSTNTPNGTEIKNNRIDDDGDNITDCEQLGGECTYIFAYIPSEPMTLKLNTGITLVPGLYKHINFENIVPRLQDCTNSKHQAIYCLEETTVLIHVEGAKKFSPFSPSDTKVFYNLSDTQNTRDYGDITGRERLGEITPAIYAAQATMDPNNPDSDEYGIVANGWNTITFNRNKGNGSNGDPPYDSEPYLCDNPWTNNKLVGLDIRPSLWVAGGDRTKEITVSAVRMTMKVRFLHWKDCP